MLPVVSTITIVGILVQIMTLSGVRGLISLSVVTLPLAVLLAVLWLILPVSEAIFQYAAAPLLGVPLVFLFNMKGLNLVMAVAGMACISLWGLLRHRSGGRASVLAVAMRRLQKFLAHCIIPALFVMALATAYIIFSSKLSFLVRG